MWFKKVGTSIIAFSGFQLPKTCGILISPMDDITFIFLSQRLRVKILRRWQFMYSTLKLHL